MDYSLELTHALAELSRITGIHMDIQVNSPEEMSVALEQIHRLNTAYKEKYSKNYFLLYLMNASQPIPDLYDRAKRLHIQPELSRILVLLEAKSPLDDISVSILKQLFPYPENIHFITIDEYHLAILLPVNADIEEDIDQTVLTIMDTLETEAQIQIKLAYSDSFDSLNQLSNAYRQTRLALKVGQLFYSEQTIYPFNRLGIGRLIYQIPRELCIDFIKEIFGDVTDSPFDTETLAAADKFFQNNLNISETSRQLYIHRNTLIYRLDQIQKRTGLDLRNFEDALTFKIAMMLMNCLQSERNDSHER